MGHAGNESSAPVAERLDKRVEEVLAGYLLQGAMEGGELPLWGGRRGGGSDSRRDRPSCLERASIREEARYIHLGGKRVIDKRLRLSTKKGDRPFEMNQWGGKKGGRGKPQ